MSLSLGLVGGKTHMQALQESRAAHQRVLEAAQVLESDIERLSWGLRDVQWACPHSHSSSCLHSRSLDRWPRSPSRPQQERRVTFWELEVELDPEERPYREVLGQSSRMFPESGDRVLPSSQRQENAHPPGRPMAYPNAVSMGNYPQIPPLGILKPGWIGGLAIGYALLVDRTHHHLRGGRPKETCLENLGFLFDPSS